MPVVKRARYEAVCDMCDRQNGSVEYTSKRETRQAVQKEGWEVDGDALYCEYCATRAGWRCQGCNRWYPARPAYTSCATCDKAAEARWMRGGDGSHWDGCYASHWDCAIRELRKALGNFVVVVEGDWSEDFMDRAFTRAIEIYDATEEKYDDRP